MAAEGNTYRSGTAVCISQTSRCVATAFGNDEGISAWSSSALTSTAYACAARVCVCDVNAPLSLHFRRCLCAKKTLVENYEELKRCDVARFVA